MVRFFLEPIETKWNLFDACFRLCMCGPIYPQRSAEGGETSDPV